MAPDDRAEILQRLSQIEMWADQAKQDCYMIRAMVEKTEDVSTFSNTQSLLTEAELSAISFKRRKSLFQRKGR
jgi:hypothetical protein